MYLISKEFQFSASHKLNELPETHPCTKLHGHNYRVKVILIANELSEEGFVLDYRELDLIKKYLDLECDHKHLNDVFLFNPTAENLANYFYYKFKELLRPKGKSQNVYMVEVSETDKTWARYWDMI